MCSVLRSVLCCGLCSVLCAVSCAVLCAVLCTVLWLVLDGPVLAFACLAAAALCELGFAHMAQRQFGGITGDLAGWLVQAAELCLTAVIVMGGMLT